MIFRHLLLPLAAMLAFPAFAQEDRGQADGDIVVTGEREREVAPRAITRQAREISRMGNFHNDPLARFEDRACPGVIGLRQDAAEMMVGMIRARAELLGIPLASENRCSPNIVVLFSADGRAELKEFQRKHHYLSDVLSVGELRELMEDEGPVRVWSIVETRMANGMPVARRRDLVNLPVGRMWAAHSKLTLSSRQDIVATLVVFDRDAVVGKSLAQLADYAAMRSFARTRDMEGEAALDTILGLFSGDGPKPPGLTPFDRAYLASLYDGVANIPAAAKLLRVESKLQEGAAMQAAE